MPKKTNSGNKHEELLALVEPILDFMRVNNYNSFFIAGKDGKCARFAGGNPHEIIGMITGMMRDKPEVEGLIKATADFFDYEDDFRDKKPPIVN